MSMTYDITAGRRHEPARELAESARGSRTSEQPFRFGSHADGTPGHLGASYTTLQLRNAPVAYIVTRMTAATTREANLDAAFDALAHPVRRAIIRRLARGEATVTELAEPFDLTHQAVSRHVGILRDRGLIHQRVDGQRRPCRLDIERMQDVADWILEQRREWESRLARLDGLLAAMQEER